MPRPDPQASDWSDLDLLTVEEATERLDDEANALRARLTDLADGPELAAAQHRLGLLTAARDRAAAGPRRPLHGHPA